MALGLSGDMGEGIFGGACCLYGSTQPIAIASYDRLPPKNKQPCPREKNYTKP